MNRRDALKGLSAASAVAAMTPVASRAAAAPAVMTQAGPVTGQVKGGVSVFLGVRYGADTGKARFQPPVKPAAWKEPAPALAYGASAPQGGRDLKNKETQSEDCLFLNVWTPEASSRRKRPVMVYIHGGAYSGGSGSDPLYDGTNLCLRGDVVVVTINHRLNVFGYLYLARLEHLITGKPGPLAWSGNAGQMDLHLGLEWVRDNIAAFGGDPDCVMVFGQSGGGAKIATMMATPAAKGLFHRAATMSGQQVTASGPGNATERATAFLKAVGLKADLDGLAKVQTLPAADLLAGLKAVDPILGGGVYMGPVLDEKLLFRHPFWPDAPAQSLGIPMMIGNTHDETYAFLGGDPHNFELTWDELPARLPKDYRADIDPYLVIDTYRRLYPDYTASEVFFAATTAGRSWRGAIEEDEARARAGAPVYAYEVDFNKTWKGPRSRAQHMTDIPLAFANTAVPDSISTDSPEARHMADLFSDAFIAFARTGSPQTPALPEWKRYTIENRETMVMDIEPKLVNDPRGEERKLFAKVPFIQAGT